MIENYAFDDIIGECYQTLLERNIENARTLSTSSCAARMGQQLTQKENYSFFTLF